MCNIYCKFYIVITENKERINATTTSLLGENVFIKSCTLSIQTILVNIGIKQIKSTGENSSQRCILQSITKVRDPSNRIKIYQKLIFWFFTTVCYRVKSVHIRSYSGPHFSAFGLNTEKYSLSLRICPNAGKCGPE